MTNTITAVLIDTVSIQEYIFSSSKLKDNVGASYIVEYKIEKVMLDTLNKQMSVQVDENEWRNYPNTIKILEPGYPVEIAYIGGGNTMLLFKTEDLATIFIKAFTLQLLVTFPGIRTAFGILRNMDLDNFKLSRNILAKKLAKNKSLHYRNVTVPKHGITVDCPYSNEAAECMPPEEDIPKFISVVSDVKQKMAKNAHVFYNSNKSWKEVLGDDFIFPNELDDLGHSEEKRYIAVVHIDGNNIGKEFQECKNLQDLRNLSIQISNTANGAMQKLVREITRLFEEGCLKNQTGQKDNNFNLSSVRDDDNNKYSKAKWYLPIRPLIVAGDDITFVCEGQLGVYLAERLMYYLANPGDNGKPIISCAGVAVVKSKYPFSRAYQLAEELTKAAKQESKKKENDNGPYLDFLISSSGFFGSLETIRNREFLIQEDYNLHFGPYQVDGNQGGPGLEDLKLGMKEFHNSVKWPRSKVMALRDVLTKSKAERDYFLTDAEAAERKLPEINGWNYHKEFFGNKKSPYYEMIELLDFYPKILLP